MTTIKQHVEAFLVLCFIYSSAGLLDTDNTLLKAIIQLNSTFQQTAAELKYAKNAISSMNSTIQKSVTDLQNDKNIILEMNTTIQKSVKAQIKMNSRITGGVGTLKKLHCSVVNAKLISAMNATIQNSDRKISALEQEVNQLEQGTTAPIIFYASLSNDTKVGPDQIIRFDHVLTNVGNAYDPRLGHFTAPVDGYYHFSVTVISVSNDSLYISIVRNGVSIAKLYAEYSGYQIGSGSVNIELADGDLVWLVHTDSSLHTLGGDRFCLFSGFIISKKT